MIPKIIHYCWFGGNPLTKEAEQYIETWKKYCPDYEIIEWNEDSFDIKENDYCREAYEAKKWAFVADYVRLKVLYEHGGIYMDTDVEVRKNFDELLNDEVFCCFENNEKVSIGTIGAVPNHIFVKGLIEKYDTRHFIENGVMDLTTNLNIVTSFLVKMFKLKLNGKFQRLNNGIHIYPMDYFIAKSYRTGELQVTNNTFAIHHYEGSWLDEDRKKIHLECQKILKKLGGWSNNRLIVKIVPIVAYYNIAGIFGVVKFINDKINK